MTLCAVVVAAVLVVALAWWAIWHAEFKPGDLPPPEEHTLDPTGRRFGDREWRS